jgi:hypothetical protein
MPAVLKSPSGLSLPRLDRNHFVRGGQALSWAGIAVVVLMTVTVGLVIKPSSHAATAVPGQSYLICDNPDTFLTSPWTYHALASGSQTYTVAQYQALSGYGTALPPLPGYISAQGGGATAAVIFAPGANTVGAAYEYPSTPILYFFEGGQYGALNFQTISGDQFIGGSASGFPEPKFDDGGGANGISNGNDSYGWSGGTSTLAATAGVGATTVTTTSAISAWANKITFSDGSTYGIAGGTATSIDLSSPLTSSQAAGSSEWTNSNGPIATLAAAKAQGATTITLTSSSIPLVQYGHIVIGTQDYEIDAITGSQSAYTITINGGLDMAAGTGTPVYYNAPGGNVTVSYLDISNDLHSTTGTLTLGQGWEVSHNKVHDSYRNPGEGVAIYGGDQSTVEYNCFDKMGNYAGGGDGVNAVFRRNEVKATPYAADPGCGCSGVGKWWGSLNADIVDNAFIEDGVGEGQAVIWLDNGNSGTNISGNYFYHNQGRAIEAETGFNVSITNNLIVDNGWGTGSGCGDSNCTGAVDMNSTGGFHVPGSRYDNQVIISGNQFVNNWGGVTIWESGLRNCASSGEGWPNDAAYCTGGFPTTALASAGGEYYFSHMRDSTRDPSGTALLEQSASAGATSILVRNAQAINDQIGFADPVSTTTSSTTNVSTLAGAGTINAASTASFPSSGQLRVDTSVTGGGGGLTGAILSYTGKTATSFTGVALVRGSGSLTGPMLQVQPYKVVSQTCYANDCAVTITPGLTSSVTAGMYVTAAGTCPLFATGAATPTNPLAPNGTSYFDGCQWGTKHISVTGNDFVFDPAYIASHAPVSGGGATTTCTAAHANNCGTNFMMFQGAGVPPYNTLIEGNSMMSNAAITGCPSWDSGCTSSPLKNLNALPNPPAAPANNNEQPSNNTWDNNTYEGPWAFNAFNYGPCVDLPVDQTTGKSMPADACNQLTFAKWQGYWQQDMGSVYSATVTPTPSPTATPSGTPTPTASPAAKIGDLNHDGFVNIFDLSILLSAWGTANATADLNTDGTVSIYDLSILLSHWGT